MHSTIFHPKSNMAPLQQANGASRATNSVELKDAKKTASNANVQPDLTDANMTVFNDNPQPITVTVSNNTKMGDEFPSPSTISAGSAAARKITASNWPGQSSFNFHFATGDTMNIELGTGVYSTKSNPETFANGKSAALLAPGPPLTTDVDFHFYLFNGPGVLPPLINSFIQANLPAILGWINTNPITIDVHDSTPSLSFQITSVTAVPQTLQCVYASTLPMSTSTGSWYLNAVFRVGQATMQGNETIEGQTGDFTLGVTDAMIWVNMQVDPTLKTMPQVLQLQMSLGNYTLSGTIVKIIAALLPEVAALLPIGATAYRVAGAINNQLNANILSGINGVLKGLGTTLSSLGGSGTNLAHALRLARHLLATPRLPMARISPAPNDANLSTWMSGAQIQAKTLGQLKIPGTHDSATYQLSSTLSQVSYSDIQLLWYLNAGVAPTTGTNPITVPPTQSKPDYIGQPLYDWVMGVAVNSISRTQDLTISQQLQAGIRHFDFRVYFDTRDSTFYTQHALQGPSFLDILTQFKNFLGTDAGSGELIFANISHTNIADHPEQIPNFANLVKLTIPAQNLYYQPTPSNQKQFDFQTLATATVGSITNGVPKIMFINGDSAKFTFADTITNTTGYSGVPWGGELYTVQQVSDREGPALAAAHDPLWGVSWVLGADTPTIVQNILVALTGVPQWALQSIATAANAALPGFFQQYGTNFNLLEVDWLEYGASPSIPQLIINMNSS